MKRMIPPLCILILLLSAPCLLIPGDAQGASGFFCSVCGDTPAEIIWTSHAQCCSHGVMIPGTQHQPVYSTYYPESYLHCIACCDICSSMHTTPHEDPDEDHVCNLCGGGTIFCMQCYRIDNSTYGDRYTFWQEMTIGGKTMHVQACSHGTYSDGAEHIHAPSYDQQLFDTVGQDGHVARCDFCTLTDDPVLPHEKASPICTAFNGVTHYYECQYCHDSVEEPCVPGETYIPYQSGLHTRQCIQCSALMQGCFEEHRAFYYLPSGVNIHASYCGLCGYQVHINNDCTPGGVWVYGTDDGHINSCTVCGNTMHESHDWSDWRMIDDQHHGWYCSVCQSDYDVEAHDLQFVGSTPLTHTYGCLSGNDAFGQCPYLAAPERHSDNNNDRICDVCTYPLPFCLDCCELYGVEDESVAHIYQETIVNGVAMHGRYCEHGKLSEYHWGLHENSLGEYYWMDNDTHLYYCPYCVWERSEPHADADGDSACDQCRYYLAHCPDCDALDADDPALMTSIYKESTVDGILMHGEYCGHGQLKGAGMHEQSLGYYTLLNDVSHAYYCPECGYEKASAPHTDEDHDGFCDECLYCIQIPFCQECHDLYGEIPVRETDADGIPMHGRFCEHGVLDERWAMHETALCEYIEAGEQQHMLRCSYCLWEQPAEPHVLTAYRLAYSDTEHFFLCDVCDLLINRSHHTPETVTIGSMTLSACTECGYTVFSLAEADQPSNVTLRRVRDSIVTGDTLPADAAAVITEACFTLPENMSSPVERSFTLRLMTGARTILPAGIVTVIIPLDSPVDAAMRLMHLNEGGALTEIPCEITESMLTFDTDQAGTFLLTAPI